MWNTGWRERVWSSLDQPWDIIVIGGGITGAGILREAARAGLRVLLVEAGDFASGTSSRSSKLVHGGFRYLKNGQFRMVLESVQERERLVKEGRGLVNPLGFLLVNYRGDAIPGWVFGIGLTFYDLFSLKWGHRHYDAYDIHELSPSLAKEGLQGGYRYFDAQTDDARLVLRVIQEAVTSGAQALNYARVAGLLRRKDGQVCGGALEDVAPNSTRGITEVRARVVINATGVWADELRRQIGGRPRLRKLRGSHLVFSSGRFPLTRSISFLHPTDGRPVFALPWEGVTILGTTDVDHREELETDPSISLEEADYLMLAAQSIFPNLGLDFTDVLATYSGFRPVLDTGKADPSKESREHMLWIENGLLTVTGGKLTTFRLMAHNALMKVRSLLPGKPGFRSNERMLDDSPTGLDIFRGLAPEARLRLLGRHGARVFDVVSSAEIGELEPIGGSPARWVELRWAARAEGVVHLDDLLLRRVRLGLLLPNGGMDCADHLRHIVQSELRWNDDRWEAEFKRYISIWQRSYSLLMHSLPSRQEHLMEKRLLSVQ